MTEPSHPFALRVRRALAERAPVEVRATDKQPAAVLVALFEDAQGDPSVWLLRRNSRLRSHAGQVALPGGKRDAEDRDLVATALREAMEEIALPATAVQILGPGDAFDTSTGYVITPVVGWIAEPFVPRPNPIEVSRVFSAKLATFADEGLAKMIPFEGLRRLALAWSVDGEIVWGATARILSNLAKRVK